MISWSHGFIFFNYFFSAETPYIFFIVRVVHCASCPPAILIILIIIYLFIYFLIFIYLFIIYYFFFFCCALIKLYRAGVLKVLKALTTTVFHLL